MPRELPPFELPRTDDPKELSVAIEDALNDLVLRLNAPTFTNILDMNANRIKNVGRCAEVHDAINRECLESILENRLRNIRSGGGDGTPGADAVVIGTNELDFRLTEGIFPDQANGDANRHAFLARRSSGITTGHSGSEETFVNFWEAVFRPLGTDTRAFNSLSQNAPHGDTLLWMGRIPPDFTADGATWNLAWKIGTNTEYFIDGNPQSASGGGTAVAWGATIQTFEDGDTINKNARFPRNAGVISYTEWNYTDDITTYNIDTSSADTGPLNQTSWDLAPTITDDVDFSPGRLFVVALKRGRAASNPTLDLPLEVLYFTLKYKISSE